MMPRKSRFGWLAVSLLLAGAVVAAELPVCVTRVADETPRAAVLKVQPTDEELLARLAYAEGRSTGFADDPRVYQGIAWGVMNRVRLSAVSASSRRQYGSGVAGVIFQPKQFNPAVSPRSAFSKDFLCPRDAARWGLALDAARAARRGQNNPFIQTPWERRRGLSLVVNFYYPRSPQARGPLAPWEGSRALRFIGDVSIDGGILLAQPPGDLREPVR